ncbi:MAG: hypothetical protein GEU75_15255, partial [Dehalococcoidia bacterium]|nr:hypothetical protein [Dehalococcoidia bacterium]
MPFECYGIVTKAEQVRLLLRSRRRMAPSEPDRGALVLANLVVSLFGPPRIEVDGLAIQVDTRKAIALLAYLAVEGQVQSRETLAALLWPESDGLSARSALRRTLSTLRTALGRRWLDVDRQTVRLDPEDLSLDVSRFRDLVDRHRRHSHPAAEVCPDCTQALAEAADLYRGDLLAGFSLRDSPEFDDWQAHEADVFREQLAVALDGLIAAHAATSRFQEALTYARRRLSLDLLQESTHQVLMRLHALRGDRSAALQQYR